MKFILFVIAVISANNLRKVNVIQNQTNLLQNKTKIYDNELNNISEQVRKQHEVNNVTLPDKVKWVGKIETTQRELETDTPEQKAISEGCNKYFEEYYHELLKQDVKYLQMQVSKAATQSKVAIHLAIIQKGRVANPGSQNFFVGLQISTINLKDLKWNQIKMLIFSEIAISGSELHSVPFEAPNVAKRDSVYPMQEEIKSGMKQQFLRVIEILVPDRITHLPEFLGAYFNKSDNIIAEFFDMNQGFFFARFKLIVDEKRVDGYQLEQIWHVNFEEEKQFYGYKKQSLRQDPLNFSYSIGKQEASVLLRTVEKDKDEGDENVSKKSNDSSSPSQGGVKANGDDISHGKAKAGGDDDEVPLFGQQITFEHNDPVVEGTGIKALMNSGGLLGKDIWSKQHIIWGTGTENVGEDGSSSGNDDHTLQQPSVPGDLQGQQRMSDPVIEANKLPEQHTAKGTEQLDQFYDGATLDHNLYKTWQDVNDAKEKSKEHQPVDNQKLFDKLTGIQDQLGAVVSGQNNRNEQSNHDKNSQSKDADNNDFKTQQWNPKSEIV